MLKIFKGDDTGGTFGRTLEFTIAAADGISLAGCYAEFVFDGIVKTFAAPLVDGETREIFYSHNETKDMRLGVRSAAFRIIDSAGKVRTMDNTVAVKVTNVVAEAYPGSSSATVTVGGAIRWGNIEGRPASVVQTINGEEPDANGNFNITESGGDMNHADFNALEDATAADTIGALKAKYNALLAICKGVAPVVAMAFSLIACGDALALTSATVFDNISGTNTIGEVVKAGGLTASDVHARPDDWMPTAEDTGAVAVQANGGVAIGEGTAASGYYSHAEGYFTTASGYASHAEGYDTTAYGYYSHAEGYGTTASGDYSHAEGFHTTASGYASHAEGYNTTASGIASHAEGYYTTADGIASHAEGVFANANENYAFSWNGDESITYNSHGVGTFNLNPLGGLSGLWIGESNLETILGGYAKQSDVGSRGATNITDGVTSGTYDEETRTANIRPLLGYTNYALSETNQTLALDRSVQYVSISGTDALKVLAPTRVYDKARDFIVYVNAAGTNALDLTELTGIYATDASATNAVTKGMTMLMFTELTTNTWVIGRQTLKALK